MLDLTEDLSAEELSNEQYHHHVAVSASTLKRVLFEDETYEVANNIQTEQTPAMKFGTLAHCLILEPHKFDDEYIVMPKVDLRTTVGKETKAKFETLACGKEIIMETDYQRALDCVSAIKEDGVYDRLIAGGESEVRFLTTFKDIPLFNEMGTEIIGYEDADVRGMVDNINRPERRISDLKMTQTFGAAFARECAKRGHGLQLAFYNDLAGDIVDRLIIGVQSVPPHKVTIVRVSQNEIETGRDFYSVGLSLMLDIKKYPHKYKSRLCYNRANESVIFDYETPFWQHLQIDKLRKQGE